MKIQMCNKGLLVLPALLILALSSGCSNTAAGYQPLVDGPQGERYAGDLQACQQLAQKRSYWNGDVKTEALLGGVLGALSMAGDDELNATEGFVIGSLAGVAERSWETRDERKNIVTSCMRQRGHRVVG